MADSMPSTWRVLHLGDAVTLSRGIDLPAQSRSEGRYPVIGSNGVVGFHSAMAAHGPGVLVGRSGSVGEVTYLEEDYWPLNTTLWVRDFHGNDPLFVSFFLRYLDLGRFTAGVSVPTLNRNILHRIEVRLPPVAEQRAIADVLQTVQKAKETRQRELALERERKAALMEYLFTHGTRGGATHATQIGRMPVGWKLGRLGELTLKITDGAHRTPTYIRDGVPFLRVVDIQTDRIDWEKVKRIPEREHAELVKRCRPERGDVLLSKNGTIGITKVVDWDEDFSIFVSLCLLKTKKEILSSRFLAEYLSSAGLQQVLKRGKKMTVTNLHLVEINELLIPVPPIDEQAQIAAAIESMNRVVELRRKELALVQELFVTLLSELLSGRLEIAPLISKDAHA